MTAGQVSHAKLSQYTHWDSNSTTGRALFWSRGRCDLSQVLFPCQYEKKKRKEKKRALVLILDSANWIIQIFSFSNIQMAKLGDNNKAFYQVNFNSNVENKIQYLI